MAKRDLTLVSPPPDRAPAAAVVELETGQTAPPGADAAALEQAWADVQRLEASYERAFEDAMRQTESGKIAAAFDEADRLQGRLMHACRRFHQLRKRSAEPPAPPDPAA